jgi:hypothetical protein
MDKVLKGATVLTTLEEVMHGLVLAASSDKVVFELATEVVLAGEVPSAIFKVTKCHGSVVSFASEQSGSVLNLQVVVRVELFVLCYRGDGMKECFGLVTISIEWGRVTVVGYRGRCWGRRSSDSTSKI